jgi:hypothetical protein
MASTTSLSMRHAFSLQKPTAAEYADYTLVNHVNLSLILTADGFESEWEP